MQAWRFKACCRPSARCIRVVSALLAVALLGPAARPQAKPGAWANEYELKAALVYKLIAFADWPAGVLGDRMVIGFAGEGPMAATLDQTLRGKRIAGRAIEVREVRGAGLRACNVVVLAYRDQSRMREALDQLHNATVLTIGDGEGFVQMGGIIALVPQANTFHLAINPRAAERSRIKISSRLMSMAKLISDEEVR